ncbi:hypothetical protein A2U01_0017719 [Trifolium medium]|uniref:Uncharacterized protein n=1 Tax=Trifolium medium TaxID=97028 RepID=A0A392NA84_9FABA|nr:hypothetical protein [Trifolium medium]
MFDCSIVAAFRSSLCATAAIVPSSSAIVVLLSFEFVSISCSAIVVLLALLLCKELDFDGMSF